LLVARGKQRLFIGTPLSFNQKIGEFLLSSQDNAYI